MRQMHTERSANSDSPQDVRMEWHVNCTHTECTMHQLSPYIGKIKSVIARDLIEQYSAPGDLVLDPFAGSFTVPLEAAVLGRRAAGIDVSPYAFVLGQAKLYAPLSLSVALAQSSDLVLRALRRPAPDLRRVPIWVRRFFHPKTLREAIQVADQCIEKRDYFILACLLGIFHHQRPGFLSYPSSHLVPYLRDKKFPRLEYPEMYEYRDVMSRIVRKIERTYKRPPPENLLRRSVKLMDIRSAQLPEKVNCIITSPPYMNALDYGRDNRLRLWLISRGADTDVDDAGSGRKDGFDVLIQCLAKKGQKALVRGGHCVVVVGDQSERGYSGSPAQKVQSVFRELAPNLKLVGSEVDNIPDIRRARRDCRGVRAEHFLVFCKS